MSSVAAGAAALPAIAAAAQDGEKAPTRDIYELRQYRLRKGVMEQRAEGYFKEALVPTLRRMQLGPVGVFNVMIGPESPTKFVLIRHSNAESVMQLHHRLAADEQYQKSGEAFLSAPASDPPYDALESSLLMAFDTMQQLLVPPNRRGIFELRTYHSPSERAGDKKVEMFNTGEIEIFRRVGLTPVFFGQRLFGANQPSLTYMLTYPDMEGRQKAWGAFGKDPAWKKLSTTPGYTDAEIVSSITNILLTPASYSQI
ncbi:MAG TPA: NIPSNAP family protein [Tepidisphaeraceae bacterium]|nr:NIPSNAP family protein [Tepidisphaeraceae bacterium]